MAKSYLQQEFLDAKVLELVEAYNAFGSQPATEEQLAKYFSLNNGIKKVYLEEGIISEAARKIGKKKLYVMSIAKCNTSCVKCAYQRKRTAEEEKERSSKAAKVIQAASELGFKATKAPKQPKSKAEEPMFPSVEDCKAYLKHLGCDVFIIPEGFELDTITLKKK